MPTHPKFLEELTWRGLVQDCTPGLPERLAKGPMTGYVGFDPTARSLQVGNLVPIMLLTHLQRAGGKPLVVIGGGTGMIGDPSGKSEERPLLDVRAIEENIAHQRTQFERFLEFGFGKTGAEMVNNADWLLPLRLIGFLRDVGKHFPLSLLLQKESIKSRLESGISYTEFSYILLQAYDFLTLYRNKGCELQMGGSDQWGNITAGTELIRRAEGGEAHALCAPLFATAAGRKFGKTEAGTIWLDPDKTSAYQFYQFWINADDRDVERYLKVFTFLEADDIAGLMEQHRRNAGSRLPHRALALDLTARVHGEDAAARAAHASRLAFGEADPTEADARTLEALAAELPSGPAPGDAAHVSVVDLLTFSGLATSKAEARRLIQQGGIEVNGRRVTDVASPAGEPLPGGYYWVSRGKKQHYLFTPST
jgi:tyrosyl-tRNA synthetase